MILRAAMTKRVFSNEERRKILAEYHAASEPTKVFCKRHNLNPSTLYYWLEREKRGDGGNKTDTVRMLPVIEDEEQISDLTELILPKGMSLRFSSGTTAKYIAAIIKALA
jgi:transposase-like protein